MTNQQKTYKVTRDGKEEQVPLEEWAWCVVYKDGDEFRQFDDLDGKYHFISEIVMESVRTFIMYKPADETKRFDIMVEGNVQLFLIYRNLILAGGSPEERRVRTPVFGWKNKETGDCAYHYILPNGNLVMSAGHDSLEVSRIVEALEANKE